MNPKDLLPFWNSLLNFLLYPFVLLMLALMLVLALLLAFKGTNQIPRPWFPQGGVPSPSDPDPWFLTAAVLPVLVLVLLPVPPMIMFWVLLSGGAGAIGCLAAFFLLMWFASRPTRAEIDSHSSETSIQRVRQSEYPSKARTIQARHME